MYVELNSVNEVVSLKHNISLTDSQLQMANKILTLFNDHNYLISGAREVLSFCDKALDVCLVSSFEIHEK